jgi:polyhydroxyalkanoate synthesis repressor PhaR
MFGIAIGNLLHAQSHRAQARAAQLVHAPGRAFHGMPALTEPGGPGSGHRQPSGSARGSLRQMAKNSGPVTIKKYANRRLYNTGTSTYVTLDDLAVMVKKGDDFVVLDAKSGDEITHSVLTQIIFEQESKTGNTLLPVSFLRQLIAFYGDQLQMVVPSYLEHSMAALTEQQEQMRAQLASSMGENPVTRNMQLPMQLVEDQVKPQHRNVPEGDADVFAFHIRAIRGSRRTRRRKPIPPRISTISRPSSNRFRTRSTRSTADLRNARTKPGENKSGSIVSLRAKQLSLSACRKPVARTPPERL